VTGADGLAVDLFQEHRSLLMGVAYRILGRVGDAEDVVQEAWLRWTGVDHSGVEHPKAFLVQVVTRLALDRLRRIKARREDYVGPWLPEPLLTEPDVAERVERNEALSLALLVVLESLSPLERSVFVLREAFDYSYAEIAEILGRSEAAARQLGSRARSHVDARQPRFESDRAMQRQVTERFLAAMAEGDMVGLLGVLAPSVTLVADGGGLARAPHVPLRGVDAVVRFLLSIVRPRAVGAFLESLGREAVAPEELRAQVQEVNGEPAIVAFLGDQPITVLALDVAGDRVQTVRVIANPEKMRGVAARYAARPHRGAGSGAREWSGRR
jgi:RNA polymerase sigma-70 factor (ECF subfamily)